MAFGGTSDWHESVSSERCVVVEMLLTAAAGLYGLITALVGRTPPLPDLIYILLRRPPDPQHQPRVAGYASFTRAVNYLD
jgi:hypothetical protein